MVALEGPHVRHLAGASIPPLVSRNRLLCRVDHLVQVKRVGVQAVEDPNLALPFAHDRNMPVIVTAHPALLLRPADWERWIHVCGPAVLPAPPNWQPSDDLNEFITRGLPPVYISFGSYLKADVEALTALAIDAAQASGLRAIIDTSFEGVFASPRRMPQVRLRLLLLQLFCIHVHARSPGQGAASRVPGGCQHKHRGSH
jgi:hypothetical protein